MAHGQGAASETVLDGAGGAAAGQPLQGLGPGPGGAVGAVVAGNPVHGRSLLPSRDRLGRGLRQP